MKLHHLGIACADIKETLAMIKKMFPVTGQTAIIHDPEQNADLCLVSVLESPPLELISGPVVDTLVKKGVLLYHTCWAVDDLEAVIARFCETGCRLISGPKKAVLFDDRRVAFLITPTGFMELLEVSR